MWKRIKNKAALVHFKRDFGGKEIIMEIGLAIIAISLLLVFKTGVSSLITDFVTDMGTTIKGLFADIT